MILDCFGLREQPFGVTPDPRYLYLSPTHRTVLASLAYGIEVGGGPLVLIAEPGLGKTTLLVHLTDRFRHSARVVPLLQARFNSRECLLYLLAELGTRGVGGDLEGLERQLREAVLREANEGRRFVLVIDEAQDFGSEVLERLLLLSDWKVPNGKPPQVVVAGQPHLADKLEQHPLALLRGRAIILGPLAPLTAMETGQYINHRLRLAGYDGDYLFTSGAHDLIASQSEGVPRNINNICFSALTRGYARKRRRIDVAVVQEAVAGLDFDEFVGRLPESSRPRV